MVETPALLFDFNGVIVDDEEHHRAAFTTVLAQDAIPLSRDAYYAHYLGLNDRTCFLTAYERAGKPLSPGRAEQLVAEKSRAYEGAVADALALIPGAPAFVSRAAEQFRLALVSGALRREIETGLERSGLRSCFEVIVAAEDVAACKPDPAGYQQACAALARRRPLTPARCVVIEDSLPGLAAARAAGMRCAMLATSHARSVLVDADVVWPSFDGHDPAELLALCPP
jgi:beta-phosphoglucomutase